MTDNSLSAIAWVSKQRAAIRAASLKEQDETLEALRGVYGGDLLPEKLPFTIPAIRALINSAFMAGAAYEIARPRP
jgi:hypothetical protein